MDELHLRRLNWLRRFTPRVGFSDHTEPKKDGLWASKVAMAVGADCIERHFTVLDKRLTKDGPVSIDPSELAELRRFADLPRVAQMASVRHEYPQWRHAIGSSTRDLGSTELRNRDYYRGRFASKLGDRCVDNWHDVQLDDLWL
jgi:N,N'-diacetyllegionaminate synthase